MPPENAHLRMCIGCREREPAHTLARFVRSPQKNGIIRDSRRAMPGRGAYAHADPSCLSKAQRRVHASLRLVHPVDSADVGVVLFSCIESSPHQRALNIVKGTN